MAELPEPRGQHLVAGGKRVAEGSLPSAGAGRRENKHLPIGALEDFFQILKEGQCKFREFGRAVIFHRHHHGAGDAVWDVGWSWDEKEVAARHNDPPFECWVRLLTKSFAQAQPPKPRARISFSRP